MVEQFDTDFYALTAVKSGLTRLSEIYRYLLIPSLAAPSEGARALLICHSDDLLHPFNVVWNSLLIYNKSEVGA
jgi:hypothetical protein